MRQLKHFWSEMFALVAQSGMAKFREYTPNQAWLLPPSVQDVLGDRHLCFFVNRVIEQIDTSEIENAYGDEGQPGYHPKLLLKVWLYAYCLGVTSSRRLEQRIREDLGFRYLAAGQTPDHWTLNAFRKRHPVAINNVWTNVLEWARQQGWARLGHVAIDSTRIAANASRDRIVTEQGLRKERAKLRRNVREWQKRCDRDNSQEAAGTETAENWRKCADAITPRLKELRKAGQKRQSTTDPDSRFLRQRGGFVLGYTADVAVSEDHVIVSQRVTQHAHDSHSLTELVDEVEKQCRELPDKLTADTGFYQTEQIQNTMGRGIDVYIPDSNMARELNHGRRAETIDGCITKRSALVRQMRAKLRSPEGIEMYRLRKQTVEPVFGIIKEQRQGRRFRLRGLTKVGVEFTFITLAYNLTRFYNLTLANGI
jgi:transposase